MQRLRHREKAKILRFVTAVPGFVTPLYNEEEYKGRMM
jgi:hypothetical protein